MTVSENGSSLFYVIWVFCRMCQYAGFDSNVRRFVLLRNVGYGARIGGAIQESEKLIPSGLRVHIGKEHRASREGGVVVYLALEICCSDSLNRFDYEVENALS